MVLEATMHTRAEVGAGAGEQEHGNDLSEIVK